ncbi:MAG: DUF4412 domain-containing protein [Gammaproteobacteria bacterium]
MRSILLSLFTVLVLSIQPVSAAQPVVEFSADTVESHPQQGEHTGKLYIGKNKVRTEYDMNGQNIIQIIDLDRQEAVIINPAEKSYMHRHAGEQDMMQQGTGESDGNPCAGMQNLTCKEGGIEVVNGRKARKWEVSSVASGEGGSMQFWLDEERRIPVRQVMPDGSSMEARMLGVEQVNGRSAEKWEMSASYTNGQSMVSYQWYDPALQMIISEEQPGGFTRNLINIKQQAQPAELFSVPAGYKEISMPQGSGN